MRWWMPAQELLVFIQEHLFVIERYLDLLLVMLETYGDQRDPDYSNKPYDHVGRKSALLV